MVSRPIVVIDPAAAPRRLCMGDLEVLGGLVEPGEDPAGGRVAAGDNPGRLRSEVAFVGCRMSGAPRRFPAAAPRRSPPVSPSDSKMTHEPAARTVHADWAHPCSPCRLDALYRATRWKLTGPSVADQTR
jgi:hypothetical protein